VTSQISNHNEAISNDPQFIQLKALVSTHYVHLFVLALASYIPQIPHHSWTPSASALLHCHEMAKK